MTPFFQLCITTVLAGLMLHPVSAQPSPKKVSLAEHAEAVAALLEGKMDTLAPVNSSSNTSTVRMTTCRIRITDANVNSSTIFLYQEQALTRSISQPYRQRFLEITPHPASQSVRSLAFKPTNPERWVGRCDQPEATKVLRLTEIGSPVCSVFLKPQQGGYIGHTPPEGCPANVRGAVRITNQVELTTLGMKTWDRGFDANGKQVWGAKNEAYQYQRISN